MASESCLVAGPTGVGLGAILLNGTDDGITRGPIAAFGDFVLVVWFMVLDPGAATTMTIAEYGGGTFRLTWHSDGSVSFTGFSTTVTTAAGLALAGRWHMTAVSRSGSTGAISLYVDGAPGSVAAATGTGSTGSAGSASLTLGNGGSGPLNGPIGHTFMEAAVRSVRWMRRTYFLMRRNVVEFLQELLEREMAETVDQTTFDAAADLIDGIVDQFGTTGALCCDGFVTEKVDAQTVLEALTPFRDLRLVRNAAGLIEIHALTAQDNVVATFGLGDKQYENIVDFPGRTSASLAEAIKTLPLSYRRTRDDTGQPTAYRFTVYGDVLAVGKEADPFEMPFIYTHVSADIMRDWRRKGLITADELIEFTAGHEARKVKVGERIRLQVPEAALPSSDYRVGTFENRLRGHGVKAIPYSAAQFTYEAGTLPPADPVIDEGTALHIGANARIVVKGGDVVNGARTGVNITVELLDWKTLPIVANGDLQDFSTVVGAGSAWQAVLADDGDASYVQAAATGPVRNETFALDSPADFVDTVSTVRLSAVLEEVLFATVSADYFQFLLRIAGVNYTVGEPQRFMLAGGINRYVAATLEVPNNPATGKPWSAGEVAGIQAGIQAALGGPGPTVARITKFGLDYGILNDNPSDFSGCRFWVRGPSVTQPDAPLPSDPPDYTMPGLTLILPPMGDPTAGAERYWVWSRALDSVGRPSRLIGPTPFPWEDGTTSTNDGGPGTDPGDPGGTAATHPLIEKLTPVPDNVRTTFNSTRAPASAHLVMIFRKGIAQNYAAGVVNPGDYSFTGNTFTFKTPPLKGESLLALYWPLASSS